MKKYETNLLDSVMLNLLANGQPHALGIPAWIMRELVCRKDFPAFPSDIICADSGGKLVDDTFVQSGLDMHGYQFGWGCVREEVYVHPAENRGVPESEDERTHYRFEICPEALLRRFPHFEMVEDVFLKNVLIHPNAKREINYGEAMRPWSVLCLEAWGAKEEAIVRQHLVREFIPQILPDLIKRAWEIGELIMAGKAHQNDEAAELVKRWDVSLMQNFDREENAPANCGEKVQ